MKLDAVIFALVLTGIPSIIIFVVWLYVCLPVEKETVEKYSNIYKKIRRVFNRF